MKNRRQFLVDNVAAWFLAPELAKRIEWVAQHEDKSYLPRIRKPRQKLYASEACDGFYLCLNGPFEEDEPGKITWAQYFDIIGVDITDQQAVQDWADEDFNFGREEGKPFDVPHPDEEVDEELLGQYLEWRWTTNDSATAQAFHYLCSVDLGPSKPNGEDPLGRLELVQGPHPGSNFTYALAENEQTLSCLQHRLLELGEELQIIVT